MRLAKWAVPTLVLGVAAFAGAKGNNQNNTGLKGKIVGVSVHSIMIQVASPASSSNGNGSSQTQQITIQTSASTTVEIDKQSNMKVSDLQAGEMVIIQQDANGVATDIQAHKGKQGNYQRRL